MAREGAECVSEGRGTTRTKGAKARGQCVGLLRAVAPVEVAAGDEHEVT